VVLSGDSICEVMLIAGFLGAGKTTLLRNILKWPGDLTKTAVLVNEFGQIGIDGELLQGFNSPVFELTNGCICCTLQGELLRTLEEILDKFQPRRLFIEASGVADPLDILKFIGTSTIKRQMTAPKVVTVLDGDMWEGREYFGPLFYNQIKTADLLLLNKIDLLPSEDVPRYLEEIREINSSCSVVPTYHCQIDPEVLWKPSLKPGQEIGIHLPHFHTDHGSAQGMGYVNFAFEEQVPFNADCFRRFMQDLPLKMYRIKGFACLGDRRYFLNHVGGKTEWIELDEAGPTRLAFVGWQVNEEDFIQALRTCLESHNL